MAFVIKWLRRLVCKHVYCTVHSHHDTDGSMYYVSTCEKCGKTIWFYSSGGPWGEL